MKWKKLSEVNPCTTDKSKVSGDFLIQWEKPVAPKKIKQALEDSGMFQNIKLSLILKTLKARYKQGAEVMIFGSGRVDILKAKDEKELEEIMNNIIHILEKVSK